MSARSNDDVTDDSDARSVPATEGTIESYETETGIVFYDAENPLAWVETTQARSLAEYV